MKLTYKDKIQIHILSKKGWSLSKLAQDLDIQKSNINYILKLIEKHGIEIVQKEKIELTREGNGLSNGMIGSFLGILKSEIIYSKP